MGQTLTIGSGFDRTWTSTLLRQGVPTPYPADATFDAAVWRGLGGPTLFAPTLAWVDAPAGTYAMTIAASQVVGLDPGIYRLSVGVTAGGVRSEVFDGNLEVKDMPGAESLRVPYVKYRDLLDFFDQSDKFQSVAGDDATFLRQRSKASDQFDRDLLVRYNPTLGFVKTRRAVPDPHLGTLDVPDPTRVPPTPAELSALLAGGGVIVDENVRELVSKLTIARILDQQEVMGSQRNPYEAKAAEFRADAARLWKTFQIQVDSDADGDADYLIDRDVTFLPTGTAP